MRSLHVRCIAMNCFALLPPLLILGCVDDSGRNAALGRTNETDEDGTGGTVGSPEPQSGKSGGSTSNPGQSTPQQPTVDSSAGGGSSTSSSGEPETPQSGAAGSQSGGRPGDAGASTPGASGSDASVAGASSADSGPAAGNAGADAGSEPQIPFDAVPGWDAGVPDPSGYCEFGSGFYRTQDCQMALNCLDSAIVTYCTELTEGTYECWCFTSGISQSTIVDGELFSGSEFEPCVAVTEACLIR